MNTVRDVEEVGFYFLETRGTKNQEILCNITHSQGSNRLEVQHYHQKSKEESLCILAFLRTQRTP